MQIRQLKASNQPTLGVIHDLDQGKGRQETNPAIFDGKGHQRILNCLGIFA